MKRIFHLFWMTANNKELTTGITARQKAEETEPTPVPPTSGREVVQTSLLSSKSWSH